MRNKIAVGIDLGGTKTSGALVDGAGNTYNFIIESSKFNKGINTVYKTLSSTIKKLILGSSQEIIGIGIAASGRIDPHTGTIVGGVPLCEGYIGFPIREKLFNEFHIPVVVENDANAAAYAEYRLGAGQNSNCLLCITIGTGIGGGIIINGKILRGKGNGGEIGHIVIEKNGRLCNCGRKGCLETYVSRKCLEDEIFFAIERGTLKTKLNPQKITTKDIIKLIKDGNPIVMKIFNRQLEYLAVGIENLINTIDPDLILISGQLSKLGNILINLLKSKIRFPVELKVASLGSESGVVGAGLIVIQRID